MEVTWLVMKMVVSVGDGNEDDDDDDRVDRVFHSPVDGRKRSSMAPRIPAPTVIKAGQCTIMITPLCHNACMQWQEGKF